MRATAASKTSCEQADSGADSFSEEIWLQSVAVAAVAVAMAVAAFVLASVAVLGRQGGAVVLMEVYDDDTGRGSWSLIPVWGTSAPSMSEIGLPAADRFALPMTPVDDLCVPLVAVVRPELRSFSALRMARRSAARFLR